MVAQPSCWFWIAVVSWFAIMINECNGSIVDGGEVKGINVVASKNPDHEKTAEVCEEVMSFVENAVKELDNDKLQFVTTRMGKDGSHSLLRRKSGQITAGQHILILVKYRDLDQLTVCKVVEKAKLMVEEIRKYMEDVQIWAVSAEDKADGVEIGAYLTLHPIDIAEKDLDLEIHKIEVSHVKLLPEVEVEKRCFAKVKKPKDLSPYMIGIVTQNLKQECEEMELLWRHETVAAKLQQHNNNNKGGGGGAMVDVIGPLKSLLRDIFETMCYEALDVIASEDAAQLIPVHVMFHHFEISFEDPMWHVHDIFWQNSSSPENILT